MHLGKYYPPSAGGIETHTQTLARAQAELGADVRVVVVNHASADGQDATFERFTRTWPTEETDGPVHVTRVGRWANVAKLDVAPGLAGVLRRLAADPPDVWHLHTPNVTMMLAMMGLPRVRPLVITHHSDIVRQRLTKYAVRPVEAAVYRRAARVLSDSPGYLAGSSILRQHADKVELLPLGIDLVPFQEPSAAALGHAARLRDQYGAPLWLSVGRLIYYKGLHVALAALRAVPGRLVVIGSGPLESDLRARAAQLGVADRVVWLGRASADELVGAYHAATALWFPSVARSEGFGLVQVEAMAAGCPVVNTAIPGSGVAWVCRDGREGLTVPVGDPAAFAVAATRLLAEPKLRVRLAAGGRQRAAAEFDWRVMGRRSLDLYRAVLGSGAKTCASYT
ncbi:MAG TPA: glycosyltransferase [Gemmataceae bacterium]|nr:glycosyltransferase [Gemmataceae bacterium]